MWGHPNTAPRGLTAVFSCNMALIPLIIQTPQAAWRVWHHPTLFLMSFSGVIIHKIFSSLQWARSKQSPLAYQHCGFSPAQPFHKQKCSEFSLSLARILCSGVQWVNGWERSFKKIYSSALRRAWFTFLWHSPVSETICKCQYFWVLFLILVPTKKGTSHLKINKSLRNNGILRRGNRRCKK